MFILIVLAIALNVDALAIGISYGIRGISVPFHSMLLISLASITYALTAALFGSVLTGLFPAWVGSVLLLIIGIYTLKTALHDPQSFDFDCSKTIDLREAAALSIALSLDAAAASLSFSLSGGGRYLLPFGIGICQFAFLIFGKKIGACISAQADGKARALNLISGVILTLLGLLRLVL